MPSGDKQICKMYWPQSHEKFQLRCQNRSPFSIVCDHGLLVDFAGKIVNNGKFCTHQYMVGRGEAGLALGAGFEFLNKFASDFLSAVKWKSKRLCVQTNIIC